MVVLLAGGAGMMSIPRVLEVKNNKVYSLPIPELKKLRSLCRGGDVRCVHYLVGWTTKALLNRLYERNESVVDITQAEQVLMGLLEENTPVYQNLIIMLTDNQLALMKAIAHEGKVTAPNSGDFILGHGLKTPSSVNAALKSLVEKELVYKSTGGYMVYDRFMGIWLLRN